MRNPNQEPLDSQPWLNAEEIAVHRLEQRLLRRVGEECGTCGDVQRVNDLRLTSTWNAPSSPLMAGEQITWPHAAASNRLVLSAGFLRGCTLSPTSATVGGPSARQHAWDSHDDLGRPAEETLP